MDLTSFLAHAKEMRRLQKEFFSTSNEMRRPQLIRDAKAAERRFDLALAEMEGARLEKQPGLFEGGAK